MNVIVQCFYRRIHYYELRCCDHLLLGTALDQHAAVGFPV
jgi:hypothetical protein